MSEITQAPAPPAQRLERGESRETSSRFVRWLENVRSRNTFLVAGIAALALVIRFWNFGSLGYQHWDEYYFVSDIQLVSAYWPRAFRSLNWVTAPLVAETDGTLMHFLGNPPWIPIAVSAVYGTLACVALYFLGSRLFGAAIGLIAALVLATSEFSAMFSRMALADATFDFWLIVSVFCIWLGFERRRLRYYLLAGVSAGLLLNAKYNGIFPVVFAVSWLVAEFLVDAFRRPRVERSLTAAYRPRAFGTVVMIAIAIILFVPFFIKVALFPGWHYVFTFDATFGAHTLIKTSPKLIVWYFWLFSSPPTVLLALAGIVVGVVRFTRADRFMLVYTAGWFIALMVFAPYPREALSLMPAVAIWAARAIVEVWQLGKSLRPRWLVTAAAPICLIAILVGQAIPLAHTLSLRTQGYADAGVVAAKYQAAGQTLFIRTQAVAALYLKNAYFIDPSPAIEGLLNQRGSSAIIMTDQTLSWYPAAQHLFDLNRDRLQVIDRVPNPMFDEVLLQPATEAGLAHLSNPPDAYRYITFWRVTGQLQYPPDWPQ